MAIERSNQVWCSDITYIGLAGGFIYLFALMDWFSRYVLEWELSNALESDFCARALRRALNRYAPPQISNTDQEVQFTSAGWIGLLTEHQIAISMDGRGRIFDNIFIERLWRSLKYEEVYPCMSIARPRRPGGAFGTTSAFTTSNAPTAALKMCRLRRYIKAAYQTPTKASGGKTAGFSRSF